MVYVDTSVLVALLTNEATAERLARWYESETRPLVSADWCVTEFASALALKERTGQLTRKQSNAAWKVFDEFCSAGLRLLPLDRGLFAQAAHLVRESKHGLRRRFATSGSRTERPFRGIFYAGYPPGRMRPAKQVVACCPFLISIHH